MAIPGIAGGASYTATASVSVPAGLAPGDTNNGLTAPAQVDIVVFQ